MYISSLLHIYNLLFEYPAHRAPTISAEVVAQVLTPGIEVQAPRAGGRAPRSRPIAAARAYAARGRIVAVTGGGEEHRFPINL